MDQDKDWARQCAAAIGKSVARRRSESKLSGQRLADRCAELGMPSLTRTVITKLENGRKEAVSTAELMVLAKALSVSPAELVFPIGQASTTEVLPGDFRSPWEAILWFSGMAADPGRPADDDAGVVHLYQLHHVVLQGFRGGRGAGPSAELLATAALRSVRAAMRERSLLLPDLPPELAWIDNGDAR